MHRPFSEGEVIYATVSLCLQVSLEEITFHLMKSPEFPVVFDFPWLNRHNPHLDWSTRTIHEWGPTCHATCLLPSPVPQLAKTIHISESQVPVEYLDLKEVFSKSRDSTLSLHRPYDYSIEFLLGSCPPHGWIFSLSVSERDAIDKYIFVGKKDGGFRPCTEYHGLNKVTVHNQYPLPLMSTVFNLLQGSRVFTKLDEKCLPSYSHPRK